MRVFLPLVVLLLAALPADAASKAECRRACEDVIDDCLRTCGTFGDMRRFVKSCKRAVLQSCREEGPQACAGGTPAGVTTTSVSTLPTTTTTLSEVIGTPCAEAGVPECLGDCPDGFGCAVSGDDQSLCACEPTGRPCTRTFPQCGGDCPPGFVCGTTGSACICTVAVGLPGGTTTTSVTTGPPVTSSTSTTELPRSCADGIQNQDETDVDCGGFQCAVRCTRGQKCVLTRDCRGTLLQCVDGVCR